MCKKEHWKGQMFAIDFFITSILVVLLLLSYLKFEQNLENMNSQNHIKDIEDYTYIAEALFSDKNFLDNNRFSESKMNEFIERFDANYEKALRDTGIYQYGKNFYLILVTYDIQGNIIKNTTLGYPLKSKDNSTITDAAMDMDENIVYIDRYVLDDKNNLIMIRIGVY